MTAKILVIDDQFETLRLTAIFLERAGYDVIIAQSGGDGIIKARADRPDLILLDLTMPEMDGIAVCHEIRGDADLYMTPIVLYSARITQADEQAAFAAGIDDCLIKPAPPAELLTVVRERLNVVQVN